MARLPRLSVGGWPHLLLLRGHNRQAVFRDDDDRRRFRALLGEVMRAQGVAIHAYALLDGEIRLLATPADDNALSLAMQMLGRRYGAYFNKRHNRTGGLWDGRFRTTVVEPEQHLLSCMRFVETAGSEDAAVAEMLEAWSSKPHHIGQKIDPIVSDHSAYWVLGNTPFEREVAYRQVTQRTLSAPEVARLTDAVLKGWPLGSEAFLSELQRHTARRLVPLKRGRPSKTSKAPPN